MPWKSVSYDLGVLLHIPAVLSVPAAGVCIGFGEWQLLPGFAVTAVASLGIGRALTTKRVDGDQAHSLVMSMVTVGTAWLFISLLAAIPFLYWGWASGADAARPFRALWTAFFESISGITSTGLTMTDDASLLPRAVQAWRTLLEWVGGIGVVVLALAIIRPSEQGKTLMMAEGREHRPDSRVHM
jgi:trk system potassium uptake protein TrkH